MTAENDQPMELILDGSTGDAPAANVVVNVFYLSEYYSSTPKAGRSDPGVPRRKVGSLNDTDDLAGTVKKFATIPGAYFAECRVGRDVISSQVFELKPPVRSGEVEGQNATRLDLPTGDNADLLNQIAQALGIRSQRRRSTRDIRPHTMRRPARAPATPQVNPLEMLRESEAMIERRMEQERKRDEALQARILAMLPKENPAQTSVPDPTESFLNLYERFIDISERINPNGEARSGWLDKIAGAVESVARVASSPAAAAVVSRLLMPPAQPSTPAAPPPATAHGVPTTMPTTPSAAQPLANETQALTSQEEEETAESAASETLANLCHDLLDNADVGESAKEITRLLEDWPEVKEHIEPLLALSSLEMQRALALATGEGGAKIMDAPHAVTWLDKLKTAIALRRGPVLVAKSSAA